jgi:hypothetical protein
MGSCCHADTKRYLPKLANSALEIFSPFMGRRLEAELHRVVLFNSTDQTRHQLTSRDRSIRRPLRRKQPRIDLPMKKAVDQPLLPCDCRAGPDNLRKPCQLTMLISLTTQIC